MEPNKPFVPPKASPTASLKPAMPSTPPPEVLKMDFSDDPTLDTSGETRIVTEDKNGVTAPVKQVDSTVVQPEVSKSEATKPEVKLPEKKQSNILKPPGEKKETPVAGKEVVKPINLPSREKILRNYSGFSDEEVAHFKQMSDGAYKFTSELIKKSKELEKDTFLQHPEAYTLSPEYKETQNEINRASVEGDYWKQCLMAIKRGESFKPAVKWENGQLVTGNELKPNEEIEEAVRANMNACYQVAQDNKGKLSAHVDTFKKRITSDLQAINQEQAARFPWVADPKLLNYTIPIEGVGDLSVKQIRTDFINLFPPYHRNNPGVDVAANLFVALRIANAELQEAKSGQQIAEIKQAEVARAEPSSEVKPAPVGDPIGGVKEFSLSGLDLGV